MARLKSTYIEGDLTVEGNLHVESIANSLGTEFPYISSNIRTISPNRVIVFDNGPGNNSENAGGLSQSTLKIIKKESGNTSYTEVSSVDTVDEQTPIALKFNMNNTQLFVKTKKLKKYDDQYGWKFE